MIGAVTESGAYDDAHPAVARIWPHGARWPVPARNVTNCPLACLVMFSRSARSVMLMPSRGTVVHQSEVALPQTMPVLGLERDANLLHQPAHQLDEGAYSATGRPLIFRTALDGSHKVTLPSRNKESHFLIWDV